MMPTALVTELPQRGVCLNVESVPLALSGPVGEEVWDERPLTPPPPAQSKPRARANARRLEPELLHAPLERQALMRPEQQALVAGARVLDYRELRGRTLGVGRALRGLGVMPNELVGIVMEKGWEQPVAALGVLAAGGAYVPIDAHLPRARRHQLMADAGVRVALTQSRLADTLEWPAGVRVLAVDTLGIAAASEDPLPPTQQLDDLAYVIFSAGSTGEPRGVMIRHRAVINTILDINTRFGVGPRDRVFGLSPLSHDLSVYDVFGAAASGATLVLPEAEAAHQPPRWLELLASERVSVWNSGPAQLQSLLDAAPAGMQLPDLRLVLLSGGWIPLNLPEHLRRLAPNARVVSLGGATEASIWSSCYPIDRVDPSWRSIPYGFPLANQTFHVLGEDLEPCPTWVAGELYIGGVGLADGYWRDPETTARNFVVHPRSGERLYRTGDVGRYLGEGVIERLPPFSNA